MDEARDLALAVEQLVATIKRHLVDVPPDGEPVKGLTDAKVRNLARTIVQCLDHYGCRRAA